MNEVQDIPNGRVVVAGPGPRHRAICTYAVGRHRELAAISIEASRRYADRWGWDVVSSSEDELRQGRPASWAKVVLIQELLAEYEWVWWIDADALLVDLERDVMTEIDEGEGPVWLASHPQERDDRQTVPNAGVMLVRRSTESLALLSELWSAVEFIDHNWWENAALLHLLGYSLEPPYPVIHESEWLSSISALDRSWNTVPGYVEHPRPAIRHHARADHDNFDRRLQSMRDDLSKTE